MQHVHVGKSGPQNSRVASGGVVTRIDAVEVQADQRGAREVSREPEEVGQRVALDLERVGGDGSSIGFTGGDRGEVKLRGRSRRLGVTNIKVCVFGDTRCSRCFC